MDDRIKALRDHLGDQDYSDYDLQNLILDGDYLVLDENERDEALHDNIKESLWAFNSSFLSGETGIDENVFKSIQSNDRCESNNDAILSIVKSTCGLESFIDAAVSVEGAGHFLSSYDGNEYEINGYYIYRIN